MKISIIGAGNVGASCADVLMMEGLCSEIVLLDMKEGIAEGKALDIQQKATLQYGAATKIVGSTNDYTCTKDSNILIITAGITRSPGMSREDLLKTNAVIIREITLKAIEQSPNAIYVMVTNPLDILTYQLYQSAQLPRHKIIGMAGVLDTARYRTILARKLQFSVEDIQGVIVGSHSDVMVPLPRYTTVNGIPLAKFLSEEEIKEVIAETVVGGAQLVKLLGTSAWYAPSQAVAKMVTSIVKDQRRIFCASVKLEGEYGVHDMCLGVPIILGRKGIEKIIELPLTTEEERSFRNSESSIRELQNKILSILK